MPGAATPVPSPASSQVEVLAVVVSAGTTPYLGQTLTDLALQTRR